MLLRIWTLAMACALLAPTSTPAAPLNPADVSADAKWVAHVDCEALLDTKTAEQLREEWPEKAEKARQWMQEKYGIIPKEDLKSMTLFGENYDKTSCVSILTADFNRGKVKSQLSSKEGVQTSNWRNYTLYTYDMKKQAPQDGQGEAPNGQSKPDKSVTTVLVDRKTVVCAASEDQAKEAVKLLEGESESLEGKDSKLITEAPRDAMVYAAAIDLNQMEREGEMTPLLKQHRFATYALCETDGELRDELRLVAENQEVAKQMKEVVEGISAAWRLAFADSDQIKKMADNMTIEQNGDTLVAKWHGDAERFAQMIDKIGGPHRK